MDVTVHLHTILQRQTPEGLVRQLDLTIPSGSTMGDLLVQLEIDFPLDSLLLVVNGRLVETNHVLTGGDQVNLMPAISGGCASLAPILPNHHPYSRGLLCR
jgi:sulfur carrier protein ThiS